MIENSDRIEPSPVVTGTGPSMTIVGGGASAVLVVVALAERAVTLGLPVPRITVVEREPIVGLGIAYGRAEGHHLLNSPVGKMSVSGADPDGFLNWCLAHALDVTAGSFVPRRLFGEYGAEAFTTLARSSDGRIEHRRGEAVSAVIHSSGVDVTLADGAVLTGDALVLAVGNPPPADWSTGADRVVQDPWAAGALDDITGADRVLLIGTGLTMVDIATTLTRRHPSLRLTATSRKLLLPRTHLTSPAAPGPGVDDSISGLGDLISAVGRQVRSADVPWQATVDGLRPQLNTIWARLSGADRRRFLAHVARFWDVHRHRMAPSVSTELSALLESRALTLACDIVDGGFDVVVNCTGPRSVGTPGWNPFVDSLLAAGIASAHPLGLGLSAASTGALIGRDAETSEKVFAVGPALRGPLWETVAIPEIRQEATGLASTLLA